MESNTSSVILRVAKWTKICRSTVVFLFRRNFYLFIFFQAVSWTRTWAAGLVVVVGRDPIEIHPNGRPTQTCPSQWLARFNTSSRKLLQKKTSHKCISAGGHTCELVTYRRWKMFWQQKRKPFTKKQRDIASTFVQLHFQCDVIEILYFLVEN